MQGLELDGKNALVFGVANQRSIAWAIAQALSDNGARVALAYQNERVRDGVAKLASSLSEVLLVQCDVTSDDELEAAFSEVKREFGTLSVVVHSIAFANQDDLGGEFTKTSRDGFRIALEISAYSLVPIARHAAPLMEPDGGSIITLTFQASNRVFPGYNVMGTAKAALENEVRQLAAELGTLKIRVNALSPGPVDTLSSRVIKGYSLMKRAHADRSPLGRNITQAEIAKAALFLSSDLSSGITGTVLPVDGGYHIMGI